MRTELRYILSGGSCFDIMIKVEGVVFVNVSLVSDTSSHANGLRFLVFNSKISRET